MLWSKEMYNDKQDDVNHCESKSGLSPVPNGSFTEKRVTSPQTDTNIKWTSEAASTPMQNQKM